MLYKALMQGGYCLGQNECPYVLMDPVLCELWQEIQLGLYENIKINISNFYFSKHFVDWIHPLAQFTRPPVP